MSKEIEGENGEKETVYTAEEYTAKETEVKGLNEKLGEVRRAQAEQGNNFKRYSQMTEEERKTHDANTTNLLKREEALQGQIADLTTKISDREKRDNASAKDNALSAIHHGNEESKKVLEEKYALLTGMPETTPAEIGARTREAAKLAGIMIDPRNPLYTPISGEAPQSGPNKEYVDTPEGKQATDMARAALGITPTK